MNTVGRGVIRFLSSCFLPLLLIVVVLTWTGLSRACRARTRLFSLALREVPHRDVRVIRYAKITLKIEPYLLSPEITFDAYDDTDQDWE